MENNYWIVDDLLIFKPEFNEVLDDYYDLINKYKKIIFSNYNESEIAIKTNNFYNDKYDKNYISNKFNQKIDLSNNIHLTFGYNFNQEIDLSNNIHLTHLTLGYCFNKEINIPLNVKSLTMLCCDNQYIIDNLHNNIEELIIDETNLNLDNLPNSIKKLYIHNFYNKELNNLPNSIEYLELNNYYLKIKKKYLKNLKLLNVIHIINILKILKIMKLF